MRKEKFVPPVVRLTTGLELESSILGTSKDFVMPIEDTGHESYEYTPDNYWE